MPDVTRTGTVKEATVVVGTPNVYNAKIEYEPPTPAEEVEHMGNDKAVHDLLVAACSGDKSVSISYDPQSGTNSISTATIKK